MGKLAKASLIGLLFTIYGGSIYYAFTVVATLAAGGDLLQNFINTVEGCFLCWLICTVVFYQVLGLFDDLNKAAKQERERNGDEQ